MRIIDQAEFNLNRSKVYREIKKGAVFIHPTDTIYGIGCDATNGAAVQRLREIKGRYAKPLLVMAPSKEWVKENCAVPKQAEQWLSKWPGSHTLILGLKNKGCIAKEVNKGEDSLGVRMPDHWFRQAATELDIPIVSTSANLAGEEFMTSLDDLDQGIRAKIDFAVYEGEKRGHPSTLMDFTAAKVRVTERKR
ncbi:MAG TPA: L-threonylcarbamoyladenylate synthase [Candidatus Nanoarchaeia archaeon]|nr:L-threonylcarbamoyladenylate synthase [Candidatus Nanoarchaeia archaeon]